MARGLKACRELSCFGFIPDRRGGPFSGVAVHVPFWMCGLRVRVGGPGALTTAHLSLSLSLYIYIFSYIYIYVFGIVAVVPATPR